MRKTVFIVGFAAGYVLGARAGRGRYETIARAARRVSGSQTVQSAAGVLWAQAGSAANVARGRITIGDREHRTQRPADRLRNLVDFQVGPRHNHNGDA